jgi:hypothetical protein
VLSCFYLFVHFTTLRCDLFQSWSILISQTFFTSFEKKLMASATTIQLIENCVFFFCGTLWTFPCTLISCVNWHMEQVHHFEFHHRKQEIASQGLRDGFISNATFSSSFICITQALECVVCTPLNTPGYLHHQILQFFKNAII